MKKVNIVFVISLLNLINAYGQSFSGKTNSIFLNFKDTVNSKVAVSLPFIIWKTPHQDYTNSASNSIVIEADVFSTVDLKSVRVEISDGTTLLGAKPLEIDHARKYSLRQQINVMEGLNIIGIEVENIDGGKTGSSKSIVVGNAALEDAVSIDRKDYALFFATDKYDNWTDLVNPVDDAYSIAKILR